MKPGTKPDSLATIGAFVIPLIAAVVVAFAVRVCSPHCGDYEKRVNEKAARARRNLVSVKAELASHKSIWREYPGSIAELAGYNPGAHVDDPFSDRELAYVAPALGWPIIYSIGPDGRDDGGQSELGPGLSFHPIFCFCASRGDIVAAIDE